MNNLELIGGGLKLMVCGIGMVFVFLIVMIYCMTLMHKLLAPFAAKFEPAPAPARKPKAKSGNADEALAAAVAAAVVAAKRGIK